LSLTLELDFCVEALKCALGRGKVSAPRRAPDGGMLCCDETTNTTGYAGSALTLPVSTFRHAGFDILIQRSVSSRHGLRQEPYAFRNGRSCRDRPG
jgi:hypothetical protein